jgi:hypothetical protein
MHQLERPRWDTYLLLLVFAELDNVTLALTRDTYTRVSHFNLGSMITSFILIHRLSCRIPPSVSFLPTTFET